MRNNVPMPWAPVPTERSFQLPGLTLRARCWGDPSLPVLLALHGWLDNANSFALLAPELAQRWHVIALDLPGHGHSDHLPPGVGYHFTDYVRSVLAVGAMLPVARFHLLGHSMGAGIASLVAAAIPQCVDRLLLIEGLGPLGDDGSHTLQRFRDALAATPPDTRALRRFSDIEQAVNARVIVSGLRAELAYPIVERGLHTADDGLHWRTDPRLRRATAVRLAETQIRSILGGIEAPTSVLLADPVTSYLPAALMTARAACVASIQMQHMVGGHHLHLEHPEAVAAWISARLDA